MPYLNKVSVICLLSFLCAAGAMAQPSYNFDLIDFKVIGKDTLRLHVFRPEDDASTEKPAIVFFFGGGWKNGHPRQFYPHAEYFASRGMVAISAEYRIQSLHQTTPFESVADGKSAIRWVREHATDLGVDPDKIVAAGGSAGGHIATTTGIIVGNEDGADDLSISSTPAAMVLFNPVLDLEDWKEDERFAGQNALKISPIHHVEAEHPPTIIFHGTTDTTVPISQAQRFCSAMTNTGSGCRLMSFENMGHGFFNLDRHGNKPYNATVRAADEFLIQLGILTGKPTLSN